MKVVIINSVCGIGSTGRICAGIAEKMKLLGNEVYIAYGRNSYVPEKYKSIAKLICSQFIVRKNAMEARIFDNAGFGDKKTTSDFLNWLDEYKPDLIWLHNVHGYYINVELLFNWLKNNPQIEKRWTLHDCWSFTGHCTYFSMVNCEKWKTKCSHCPQKKDYPSSILLDKSSYNYIRKKELFSGIKNMTLYTPSKWLADLTRSSFLSEYPVKVQHNKIDLKVFRKVDSDIKGKFDIKNETVILGVASEWSKRKGLYDFYDLARMLDNKYVIVLVGLSNKQIGEIGRIFPNYERRIIKNDTSYETTFFVNKEIDDIEETGNMNKKEAVVDTKNRYGIAIEHSVSVAYRIITKKTYSHTKKYTGCRMIIAIPHTNCVNELVELYSASDYFFNPTYEDNYPTVNLEAISCGSYVITYDTGGAKETIEGQHFNEFDSNT